MPFNKPEAARQAQQFMRQGNVSSAIAIYAKIVEAEPSDLVAISTLGDLYVKSGRVQDAVDNFLRIAENYLRSGSDISARYILNKTIKLDPENPTAQIRMGELCLREGNSEKAHDWFIEAGAFFWHKGDVNAAINANERALSVNADSRRAKAALWALQQELQQPSPAPEQPPMPMLQPAVTGDLEPIFISITEDHQGVYSTGSLEPVAGMTETPSAVTMDAAITVGPVAVPPPAPEEDEALSPTEMPPLLDEAVIIDQIANAEMFAGYGRLDDAVATLRDLLLQQPDHVEVRERLKDIYLRAECSARASEECVNIAGILAARGETSRARDYLVRARRLAQPNEHVTGPLLMRRLNREDRDDSEDIDEILSANLPANV